MKIPLLPLASVLCLFLALPQAWAQASFGGTGPGQGGGLGNPGGGLGHGHGDANDDKDKAKDTKPESPPPAIPGAQPDADAVVVPSDKTASEMSPNDALFDAITRGDLAAAKDSLNRGAQLDAHNVLGQTPTDAAIDLSRNDITFLLLSMRGSAPGAHVAHVTQSATAAPARGKHGKPIVAVKAQRRGEPRALSTDRGTPNPQVGFTGF